MKPPIPTIKYLTKFGVPFSCTDFSALETPVGPVTLRRRLHRLLCRALPQSVETANG